MLGRPERGRTLAVWFVALAVAALVGCSGSNGGGETDTSWTYDDDTSVEPDGGATPHATTFRIDNATGGTIRVQKNDACLPPPGWLEVRDGSETLDIMDTGCPRCTCEEARKGNCGPCAAAGACRAPEVGELAAGEAIEWSWSGYVYRTTTVDGTQCEQKTVPPEGTTYTAEFCWSAESGPVGPGEQLPEETCETVTFRYGEDTEVVKTVAGGGTTEPQPTTFELANTTNRELEYLPFSPCSMPKNAWVSMRRPSSGGSSSPFYFETDCTTCNCSDVQSGGCAVCEKACIQPQPKALPAGELASYEFDGVAWAQDSVDEVQCHRKAQFRDGEGLTARFCWKDPATDVSYDCSSRNFRYGDATVRYDVE